MKKAKKWFEDWANEYDNTLGKINRHHQLLDLAVKQSKVRDKEKVLDLGCGTGLLSLKFLKQVDCSITAVDNSKKMLAIFKDKIRRLSLGRNIECVFGDAAALDLPKNSFDVIAATVALHHVKNKGPMIKKIYNLLKPGGRFILGEIDMDTTGKHTDPARMFRIIDYLKKEFALAMREGGVAAFKRMYANGRKHILNEGEYCLSFGQWRKFCVKAGFKKITVKPLPEFSWFKVLVAVKD